VIVLEQVLVLFGPEQRRFGPASEHFVFRSRTMQSIFPRHIAYNIFQSINTVYFARCINSCITSV